MQDLLAGAPIRGVEPFRGTAVRAWMLHRKITWDDVDDAGH